MIKTGDRFNLNNENWEVIFIDNDAVVVARSENGEEGIVSQRTIYKNWYEQQKQRADELAELYVQSEKESESLSISLCERIERYQERTTKLIQEKSKAVERADELEKRWSELVDVLKKKYEYYKVRADDESAGPIEQGKWKIAKHEVLMALMTMAELQEDDND